MEKNDDIMLYGQPDPKPIIIKTIKKEEPMPCGGKKKKGKKGPRK